MERQNEKYSGLQSLREKEKENGDRERECREGGPNCKKSRWNFSTHFIYSSSPEFSLHLPQHFGRAQTFWVQIFVPSSLILHLFLLLLITVIRHYRLLVLHQLQVPGMLPIPLASPTRCLPLSALGSHLSPPVTSAHAFHAHCLLLLRADIQFSLALPFTLYPTPLPLS
jgi:hypothetical protein